MILAEYIKRHRRGTAALTHAEATVAGLKYPMASGWFKKNLLLEVDEAAMVAAREKRKASIASNQVKAKRAKDRKKGRADRSSPAAIEAPKLDAESIIRVVAGAAAAALAARRTYINSSAFLTSFEWRSLRFEALQKYGRRCQCCGASPDTGAVMHVDHIKPRRNFPDLALDIENLQVLCDACNHGKCNQVVDFR